MVARTLPHASLGDSAEIGASAKHFSVAIQDGAAHVPAGIELAQAEFARDGADLVIELRDGSTFVIEAYFTADSKPLIEGTDGVSLSPIMVTTLAQAGKGLLLAQAQMGHDITPGAEPIGKVVTANGTVTVQHADGTTDTLEVGDPVYIYDVVITGAGSELGIAFTDESVLSLSEDARMTLDRYIYNPDGAESNMLVGLLQGTLAVVSGKIAPNGDMEVSTPVATLGIRGTSAVIQLEDVNLRVALVTDVQDGQGGLIQIYNNTTNDLLITLTESEIGQIASLIAGSSDATLTNLTPEELALITQTVSSLTSSYNQSQGSQEPNATPGSGTGDPNGINTENLNDGSGGNGNGDGEGSSGGSGEEAGDGGDEGAALPAPQLSLPESPTILEDTPTVISGISIAGPSSVTITIVADGTFQLASIAQLTFLTIDGAAVTSGTVILSTQEFSSVSFSAPIAAARAALDGLIFTPNLNVNDLNATGTSSGLLSITAFGNGQTDTGELAINVTAVNDTPVITAPASVTAFEDTTYNFTGLSISDPVEDVDLDETGAADPVKVTLVVDGASGEFVGTLSFDGATSVNFTGGDSDGSDGTLEFTGSRAEVNAALAILQFTPDQDFNDNLGAAKLTITVNDQGNTGLDPGTSGDAASEEDVFVVDISVTPVNDAPVITAPASVTAFEDTTFSFTGLSVSDLDADETGSDGPLTINLSVANGVLGFSSAPSGLTFTDNDGSDGTLEFTGSQTDINAALALLQYTPDQDYNDNLNPSGTDPSDALVITVSDNGNTGVDPSSDAGINSSPLPASGTASDEAASFTVDINITPVNDAPVITAPASVTTSEDTVFSFTGANALSIADVDSDEDSAADPQLVTLQVNHGALSFSGATTGIVFSDNDGSDGTLQFSGTVAEVNAALALLQYTPDQDYNDDQGTESLTITVNDQGNSGTDPNLSGDATSEEDQQVINISVTPVNDAPVIGGTESAGVAAINAGAFDAGPVVFGSGSGYTTPTVSGFQAGDIVTLDVTALPQGGFTFTLLDGASNSLSPFAGVVLRIAPSAYPDQIVDSYTVTGGDDTSLRYVVSPTFGGNPGYEITATATSVGLMLDEDTSGTFSGITISDVDAGTDPILVMLGVTNGVLAFTGATTGLAFTDSDGSDGTLAFSGSQTDINAALASLDYTPDEDFSGTDALDITLDDQGATGSGGAQTATGSVNIAVNAVNDAPVVDIDGVGLSGKTGEFGGTSADYALDSATSFSITSGLTATFWVNDPTAENTQEYYISYAVSGSADEFVIFKGANGNLFVQAQSGTAVDTGVSVPTDGWHNFAVTYAGLTGQTQIYLDGALQTTVTLATGPFTSGGALVLGQDQDSLGGGFETSQSLNGALADVGIWNGILTSGKIGDIASGNVNPSDAQLEVFLQYNENTGNFEDQAGTGDLTGSGNIQAVAGPFSTVQAIANTPVTISGIAISDVDAGTDLLTVTLSVSDGTLDFTSGTNTSALSGISGQDTDTLIFSGSQADITAALATSIEYTSDSGFTGTDTLQIDVNDGGSTGSGGAQVGSNSIDITVFQTGTAPEVLLAGDKLTVPGSDAATGDSVGYSVAISSSGAIVTGAPWHAHAGGDKTGSAYVYLPDGSGAFAAPIELLPSTGSADDLFGFSADINSSGVVAIGAQWDGVNNDGAVYVYTPSGATYSEVAKLTAPGSEPAGLLGFSVAINDDGVVVSGAYTDVTLNTDHGAVYVFVPDGSGGYDPGIELTPSDPSAETAFGMLFGVANAINNTGLIAIGAKYDDDNGSRSGSVYIFEDNGGGGYDEVAKLVPSAVAADDWFGHAVAINDDGIVVASAINDDDAASNAGAIYVYIPDSSGNYTTPVKLTAFDGAADDNFGWAVAINDNGTIAVSSLHDDDNGANSGSVYIFEPNGSGGYLPAIKIDAPDGAAGDEFGVSVAINDSGVVTVGSHLDAASGSVYVFAPDGQGGYVAVDSVIPPTDVVETLHETEGALSTTGSFYVTDPDTSDVVSITGVSVATTGDASGTSNAALLAMFSPQSGTVIDGVSTSGTVNWTFDAGTDAFDYLAGDTTLEVTYTVNLSDGNGGTTSQDVVITVLGTNDAPVFEGSSVLTGSDTETDTAGDTVDATGTIVTSDGDTSETVHTITLLSVARGGTTAGLSGVDDNTLKSLLSFGTQTGTAAAFSTAWTFAAAASLFTYLASGEFVTLAYAIQAEDSDGGQTTDTITITINGTDAGPVAATTDTAQLAIGDSGSINLLANDSGSGLALPFTSDIRFWSEHGNLVEIDASTGIATYSALYEGPGTEMISYAAIDSSGNMAPGIAVVTVEPGAFNDFDLTGTTGDDILLGNGGYNDISGDSGRDIIWGGGTPYGDFDGMRETLAGQGGNDALVSPGGSVLMFGGAGNDTFVSGGDGRWSDFALVSYQTSTSGILANIDALVGGTTQILNSTPVAAGTIHDGFGNIDQIVGIHGLLDSPNDDVIYVAVNYENSNGSWFEVRLTSGDDTVTFESGVTGRIRYSQAGSGTNDAGVYANLDLGRATGLTSGLLSETGNPFSLTAPASNTNISTSSFSSSANLASAISGFDAFSGAARLVGSSYNDVLIGNANNNRFRGGAGNDYIDGGAGTADRAEYVSASSGVTVDLSAASGPQTTDDGQGGQDYLVNIEQVSGSLFDDMITGDLLNNVLIGLAGDDEIHGGQGSDTIYGDTGDPDTSDGGFGGNDLLYGDIGNDTIYGGDGHDEIHGGDNDDILIGGDGIDHIYGEAGADTLYSGSNAGGSGPASRIDDWIAGPEILDGGADNDHLHYEGGNVITIGGAGADTFHDDRPSVEGYDRWIVSYQEDVGTNGIRANISSTAQSVGGSPILAADSILDGYTTSSIDSLADIPDMVLDTQYDDAFKVGYNDIIIGLTGGQDTIDATGTTGVTVSYEFYNTAVTVDIQAGTGDDTGNALTTRDTLTGIQNIIGSHQGDSLIGDSGDNIIEGLGGSDNISGGVGGFDIVSYEHSTGAVTASLATNTAADGFGGSDAFANIDGIYGSHFDDTLTGDGFANTIVGSGGDDTIHGGDQNDTLLGDGYGSFRGNDTIYGDDGNDIIDTGGTEATWDAIDLAFGGIGNDTITGSGGFIRAQGGTGADIFSFTDTEELTGAASWFDGFQLDYRDQAAGIIANLTTSGMGGVTAGANGGTAETSVFYIKDGGGDEDQATNFSNIIDSDHDDTFYVDNTFLGLFGNVVDLWLAGGDDTVNISGGAFVAVRYQLASDGGGGAGVYADLSLGKATGLTGGLVSEIGNPFGMTAPTTNTNISSASFSTAAALVSATSGIDSIAGASRLAGSQYNDQLFGSTGDDFFRGLGGNDYIDGRDGTDTIEFSSSDTGVTVDLSANVVSDDGHGGNDLVYNIENVRGSIWDDTIVGDSGVNEIRGRGGDDILSGGGDDDTIYGDQHSQASDGYFGGNDTIYGDGGDDLLFGGEGNDTINGGDDDDTIVGGYGNDVLIGGDGGTNFDILDYYLEAQAYSSVYSSLPVGSVQGVKVDLLAAAAFDTFGDTDLVIGFEGVNGTDLEDILIGDDAANMLNGFGGSDNIRGGKGADTLTGDSGVDTFAYKDGDVDAVDTITDFDLANDQFDLAGLLDAAFTPGDTADYVKAVTDSTDTTVSVDFDGAANGVNFVDVAVLTGITAGNITFVYDDASNTTTVTIA